VADPDVLGVVFAPDRSVVSPDNFRFSGLSSVEAALDYTREGGIPDNYVGVALIRGLDRQREPTARRAKPRGRLSLAEEPLKPHRRGRRKPWGKLAPSTRKRYYATGRDRGWTEAQVRGYYRSGRPIEGVLRPTQEALFREPGAWEPYLRRNRTRLVKRYGAERAEGLLAAAEYQRREWVRIPGRAPSADIALYISRSK
jgi:hypothetical protein